MYQESNEMKLIRKVRNKHYEETKGMNSKELLDFFKKKGEKAATVSSSNSNKNNNFQEGQTESAGTNRHRGADES